MYVLVTAMADLSKGFRGLCKIAHNRARFVAGRALEPLLDPAVVVSRAGPIGTR